MPYTFLYSHEALYLVNKSYLLYGYIIINTMVLTGLGIAQIVAQIKVLSRCWKYITYQSIFTVNCQMNLKSTYPI